MMPVLIVAGKEFRDHLASKRFLAIFAILLLLAAFGVATGMDNYNKMLEQYKKNQDQNQQQPWFKERVASLQEEIAKAESSGAPAGEIQALKDELNMMLNPPMPSVLTFFGGGYGMGSNILGLVLMLLSIALGFDLITREREEGSLKSLLSHPVYRDSVINGKLLGAVAILVVVMGSVFLLTLAIMLFYGVVPASDDLPRLAAYYGMALLYCSVFFAIAAMISTVARTSAVSMLCVLGLVVAFIIIPSVGPTVAQFIVGEPPEMGPMPRPVPMPVVVNATEVDSNSSGSRQDSKTSNEPVSELPPSTLPVPPQDNEYQKYWEKRQMITDALCTVSPIYSFDSRIVPAILYRQGGNQGGPILYKSMMPIYTHHEPSLWDSLVYAWVNIVALIVELIVPLIVSYVMFLRADVR